MNQMDEMEVKSREANGGNINFTADEAAKYDALMRESAGLSAKAKAMASDAELRQIRSNEEKGAKLREMLKNCVQKRENATTVLANAVTEGGLLYNVDGNSNRVSAILYGPKQVIFICGCNKLVKDLDEAVMRLKSVAAPQNTKRLNCDTYCAKEGECLAMGNDASYMCDGCMSPARICCNYVISARQRHKDRLKVIFVGEELGY